MRTVKQYVEIFHLLFLSHLEKRLDKNLFILKGGCNLRFFFKSIRYSEDIDLDIQKIAKDTLQKKIDKMLENPAVQQNFLSKGLEIVRFSKPKQTETVQRWKISLKAEGHALEFPTKIEFSRRGIAPDFAFEAIDQTVTQTYGLYPIITNHYTIHAALEQKIQALIYRTETQARDIFDLKLLLDQGAQLHALSLNTKTNIKIAIENALNISFGEFKSQVVSYLMDEYQSYYNSEKIWIDIQEQVVDTLGTVVK